MKAKPKRLVRSYWHIVVPKGKTLGALMLTDGVGAISSKIQQISLTEQVSDAPDVRKLLDDFYHQVATDHQLQIISHRLFASEPFEQDESNSYIGSQACQEWPSKKSSASGLTPPMRRHLTPCGQLVGNIIQNVLRATSLAPGMRAVTR